MAYLRRIPPAFRPRGHCIPTSDIRGAWSSSSFSRSCAGHRWTPKIAQWIPCWHEARRVVNGSLHRPVIFCLPNCLRRHAPQLATIFGAEISAARRHGVPRVDRSRHLALPHSTPTIRVQEAGFRSVAGLAPCARSTVAKSVQPRASARSSNVFPSRFLALRSAPYAVRSWTICSRRVISGCR